MAVVTERVLRYRHGDGSEAWVDVTYDVPSPWVFSTSENWATNDDQDNFDLVSFRAVNDTPVDVRARVTRRNGQAVFERVLSPGSTFTDNAPFPGGVKTLADLRSYSLGSVF